MDNFDLKKYLYNNPLLMENSTSTYSYGCVMLYFNFPELNKIHNQIDSEDIYTEEEDKTYGLEDEPHCTLLYGLHPEVTLEEIKQSIDNIVFSDCKVYNISCFNNEKYDVLKFDVGYPTKGGAFLSKANNNLKQLPYTSDYPDYHPHLTIGYLKPGTGGKYIEKFKGLEYILKPEYIIYSQPNGDKTKIEIKK